MLTYADCKDPSCKKLKTFLTILELASISSDAVVGRALKKSAKETLEKIDDIPQATVDEKNKIKDELEAIIGLEDNFIDALSPSLRDKYNSLSDGLKEIFRKDYQSNRAIIEILEKDAAFDAWKKLRENNKYKNVLNICK